ncbi:MAG: glycoside-pentoside-hexuronide (GPH):cation symporter [Erysipelotrichaceae bacterium]|nr:glycoside-pentoside-hexuronide (GPH):cation symporter [Erysipelotrichaceae bacterium]MDD3810340.1 glycoside-pentoside-hexuronide (GPH):cation symporter [Erysipelotrichaceae bacterium]
MFVEAPISSMLCSQESRDFSHERFKGMLVDNTNSKYGKFIPWLVVGTLVNAVIFVILFTDFHLTGVKLAIFATVAYVLWGMTYTIMDIPYWSTIPNLTSNPEEREKISVLPRIFASMGQSLIIAGFGVQIINGLGGGQVGYHNFALIIAATFIFTIGVTVFNLPVQKAVTKKAEKLNFKKILNIIKENDQLRVTIGFVLLYNVGIQFIMGVATYYFTYVSGNFSMLSSFMIAASVAEIVGLLIFPKLTKVLSRKKAFKIACVLPFFGLTMLLAVGFIAPQNVLLTAIAGIIVKTGTGLELGCATVFLSDVVDYGEYKLGTRNEGVIFSLQTLIVKFTSALTALSIGFALDLTGYVPNTAQSLMTQNSIRLLMCVVPAVCMLIAYFVYKKGYRLDDAFMAKIVATNENGHEGQPDREVVMDLTPTD